MIAALWHVLLALAPWVLLGAAVAGVMHVVLPDDFVKRHLGRRKRGGVAKAVALGVPLPLCSCGVIPAGLGLRRDGASRGAAVGFLISTPQTGVDSILVSASFLGWPFALFKVAAATVTGLVGGWLVDRGDDEPDSPDTRARLEAAAKSCCAEDEAESGLAAPVKSCCAGKASTEPAAAAPAKPCCASKAHAEPAAAEPAKPCCASKAHAEPAAAAPASAAPAKPCCAGKAPAEPAAAAPATGCCGETHAEPAAVAPAKACCASKGPEARERSDHGATAGGHAPGRSAAWIAKGFAHATDVLRSIWGWLVFGIVISALITALVPPSAFASLTGYGSALALGAVLAISLPLYVCATASVPIAAALVAGGFPPGAALVFLMAGPATNLATIGAVHRALGRRALVLYLATIIAGSLAAGLAFDSVLSATALSVPHAMGHGAWWEVGAVVVLLGAFAWFGWERIAARLAIRRAASGTASAAT